MTTRRRVPALAAGLVACAALSASAAEKDKPVFFDPVETVVDGWTVQVDPALLPGGAEATLGSNALEVLRAQLVMIRQTLPPDRVEKLRTCPIWLEADHPTLGALQYHPGRRWLVGHDCDPRLTKHVHIPRARHLVAPGMMRKNPWVMMHELAHAYHDRVIGHGHEGVRAAWDKAVASGSYEKVKLHNGRTVRHYALSNIYEYFAEGTEAYVGSNDFYPFVRAELKEHDPDLFREMQAIWGRL